MQAAKVRAAKHSHLPEPAENSELQDALEKLRLLSVAMGRRVSKMGEDVVRSVSGFIEETLPSKPPPPPAPELHGTFALVKSGMLGTTHLEPRAFSLIRGRGKETMRGGGGGVCYEMQGVDTKGVVHRIVLQKTDEVLSKVMSNLPCIMPDSRSVYTLHCTRTCCTRGSRTLTTGSSRFRWSRLLLRARTTRVASSSPTSRSLRSGRTR